MYLLIVESDMLTVDSGPLTSEDQPISCDADSKKEQGIFFYIYILKLNLLVLQVFFLIKLHEINV